MTGHRGRDPYIAQEGTVTAMASCNEMKSGEVYVCGGCGLEIEVLKSCADSEEGACSCTEPLSCCGQPLTLKK
jgi:hypothetical protein